MASHIFHSPLPDVELPEIPLTELVLRKASSIPDHPAMIDGVTGRTYTFAQLSDAIHRLAGGLRSEGFKEGSTLALIASNSPEYAIVFHAVAVCGGTVTTLNPSYGADEIRLQLQDSGATLIITIPECVATAQASTTDTKVSEVVVIGSHEGLRSLDELMGEPVAQAPLNVRTNTIVLPYSSGTTGLPKGVMLSHYNLVSNVVQMNAALSYDSDDVALAVLPFFHIYGMQVLMCSLLEAGVTVVTLPRFDMEQALSLIQQHKVTQLFVVPPMVLGFAKHPLIDKYDLSSLRKMFCGAAPLGADLTEEAATRVDCAIVQGYGMTEASPVSHLTPKNDYKPGSCGVTAPNTFSRVVDLEGNDLGVDQEGEIWVKGPQVMLGYLNNPEATAETLDSDGWLHTGDVGRIDSDGHLFIVDRVKELIKYKGFQVAPAELEALLLTHPAVADAAVIGIPDVESDELPKAFLTLRADASVSGDEIMSFVKEHVASYKQIRLVEFIDVIPKSPSGKILRRLLRDRS